MFDFTTSARIVLRAAAGGFELHPCCAMDLGGVWVTARYPVEDTFPRAEHVRDGLPTEYNYHHGNLGRHRHLRGQDAFPRRVGVLPRTRLPARRHLLLDATVQRAPQAHYHAPWPCESPSSSFRLSGNSSRRAPQWERSLRLTSLAAADGGLDVPSAPGPSAPSPDNLRLGLTPTRTVQRRLDASDDVEGHWEVVVEMTDGLYAVEFAREQPTIAGDFYEPTREPTRVKTRRGPFRAFARSGRSSDMRDGGAPRTGVRPQRSNMAASVLAVLARATSKIGVRFYTIALGDTTVSFPPLVVTTSGKNIKLPHAGKTLDRCPLSTILK